MAQQWTGIRLTFILSYTIVLFNSPAQFFLDIASIKYPQAVTLASTLSAVAYNIGIASSSLMAGQVIHHAGLTQFG